MSARRPDRRFFELFLPPELRLVQRRALGFTGGPVPDIAHRQLGIYLLRAIPAPESSYPETEPAHAALHDHLHGLLHGTLRDSDIAGEFGPWEMLGVVRDLDGEQAFQVAQRVLNRAARSELLRGAGLWVRVGYVVYPLTAQPDLPAAEWERLVDLARWLAGERPEDGFATGRGLIRGRSPAQVPEPDLIGMVRNDLEALTHAGFVRVQRIHLLPGF